MNTLWSGVSMRWTQLGRTAVPYNLHTEDRGSTRMPKTGKGWGQWKPLTPNTCKSGLWGRRRRRWGVNMELFELSFIIRWLEVQFFFLSPLLVFFVFLRGRRACIWRGEKRRWDVDTRLKGFSFFTRGNYFFLVLSFHHAATVSKGQLTTNVHMFQKSALDPLYIGRCVCFTEFYLYIYLFLVCVWRIDLIIVSFSISIL